MSVSWIAASLPRLLVLAAWIGFYIYWVVTASGTKATAAHQSRASELAHRVPLWVAALLLIFRFRALGLDRPLFDSSTATVTFAAGLTLLGLSIAIWARRTIGANWSAAVTLKEGHELVQTGPYRFVRNPIYTGILLMFAGTALLIDEVRGAVALAIAIGAFCVKIRQEERFMLRQFPETYPAYRRRVRALVPFLL
jgi:protein-S-isoprenylcysteine O-methyltransferase Ste14